MPGSSLVNQNILAKLVPLNALLADDLKTLAEHTVVETLPAGKTVDLSTVAQKFYLLKGRAELLSGKQVVETLEATSTAIRYAVNRAERQTMLLRSLSEIQFIRVDMKAVEAGSPQKLEALRLNESAIKLGGEAPPPRHQGAQKPAKAQQEKLWMDRLVESPIFRQLSPANIRRVIERLQVIRHNKGDFVLHQGEKGTSVFVVKKGQCQVVLQNGGKTQKLALLEVGDTFGALSLLADSPHTASVVMSVPGEVLRLDKDDFFSWVVAPVSKTIGYHQALRQSGGIWLDVRTPAEYRKVHLPDSVNLPLINLHVSFAQLCQKNANLSPKGPYLVYSNEEKRASAAAYRLLEQGVEAHILRGGLKEIPERVLVGEASEAARKQQAEEAQRQAEQARLAKQKAEAEARARREAEQRARAEAEALLAQVREDAKRLEEEKRRQAERQAEEEERLRQQRSQIEEEERRRLLSERQKERSELREQFKAQLQSQLDHLRSAAESEREEHRQLEEQLADELNRLMQEKEEQEQFRENLQLERKRAEEEARLLQIQLKAARAVDERRKEMEKTLAEVDKPPPPKRSMYISVSLAGVLLSFALLIFLNPDMFNDLLDSFLAEKTEQPGPATAQAGQPTESAPVEAAAEKIPLITQLMPVRFYRDTLGGARGPEMALLPGGTFLMGSRPNLPYPDEHPQHPVTLHEFSISRYEITFEEYDHFARQSGRPLPSDNGWGRGRMPVINISWDDAVAYTQWLTERTGHTYRLPSEAEWEYAALAGAQTLFWWGEELESNRANCGDCGGPWGGRQTTLVGSFAPNPAGLYDMAGNVSEWIMECFHPSYQGAPSEAHIWEQQGQCGKRMVRGGSYATFGKELRLSKRRAYPPKARSDELGFRVVRID
jgi:formylglycine-generating enzyme required for sulfatase activity/rhodanese-related sulfurtransferase